MLIVGILLGFGAVFLLIVLFKRQPAVTPADDAYLAAFSMDQYKPMERLFCERDYAFLAAQPGAKPGMVRKLRRDRRRILKSYLCSLEVDFYRIHGAVLNSGLASAADRPELMSGLVRQKLLFQLAIASLRVRISLSALGVCTVDVRPVLEALGSLSAMSRDLVLCPAR